MELSACAGFVSTHRRGRNSELSLRVLSDERAPATDTTLLSVRDSDAEPSSIARRTDVIALVLVSLLVISVVAVLYIAKAFFLPVVAAFVVGTMLSPAASFLENRRMPRALSAVLIVGAVGAGVSFIIGLISSPVMQWTGRLPEVANLLRDKLHVLDRPLALWHEFQNMLGVSNTFPAPTLPMPKLEWMQSALEFLPPTFTEFLLFIATLILFIASWRDLRRALIMTFTSHESRLRALRVLNAIEEHLGAYLLTVTLINMGVGAMVGLICWATGMPNPAGLGALAATLNYLPIIGPVAMFTVLALVGLLAMPTIGAGLIAPLAFVAVTFLEGHFVTPTIIGRRLELNALAVFISLAFWTWLWGPMGAFLSSPLLIVSLILRDHLSAPDSPQLP
ncbi:MAG: AI-2E family transporter [Bradyrhizobium sp.]|nr:AI-2E family transporter [Bradyrhizobium sp.]